MALTEAEINKRVSDSYEVGNNVLEAVPNPLVSIRTSTYNHGPYIKQCIEGILMQKTNFAFEYIIGEDFSTDETREIVFDYARKYPNIIRVITADYNVGSKANGRRCINACRGKYMALCEGDDYWTDPLKLQKQVDFLEGHPEYTMCFHAAILKWNGKRKSILIPYFITWKEENIVGRRYLSAGLWQLPVWYLRLVFFILISTKKSSRINGFCMGIIPYFYLLPNLGASMV